VQPGAQFAVGLDVAIDVRGAARVVRPLVFRDGVATLTLAAEGEPAAVTFDPDVRQLFDGRISRR